MNREKQNVRVDQMEEISGNIAPDSCLLKNVKNIKIDATEHVNSRNSKVKQL